jgi:lipoate-protein ligase A
VNEWKILDTGRQSAHENMRLDGELLERADQFSEPILHLYEWEGDSATYGYFTDPADFLNLRQAEPLSLNLARRPTGGGILFHLWDLAFSVVVPSSCPEFSMNTLDNYAFINNAVLSSVKELLKGEPPLSLTPDDFLQRDAHCSHFCMAKPTKYDVMWEGKKVAGAAQRKTKKGFLHQGSIALTLPSNEYLEKVLLPGTQVQEAMQALTCPLLGRSASKEDIVSLKKELCRLLATHLTLGSLSLSS